MALLTRSDIKKLCGVDSAYIRIYEKRHKIVFSGDFIDDSLEINKSQINKWVKAKKKKEDLEKLKEFEKLNPPEPKEETVSKTETVQKTVVEPKIDKGPKYAEPIMPVKKVKPPPTAEMSEYARVENQKALKRQELEDKKKQVEYEKKVLDKKKVELEIAKTRGELIPTKLVSSLVSNLGASFQNNYKNQSNQLLIEIAQKTRMSDKDLAFFKGELIKSINKSHRLAINEAKKNVENIISENSIVEDG